MKQLLRAEVLEGMLWNSRGEMDVRVVCLDKVCCSRDVAMRRGVGVLEVVAKRGVDVDTIMKDAYNCDAMS